MTQTDTKKQGRPRRDWMQKSRHGFGMQLETLPRCLVTSSLYLGDSGVHAALIALIAIQPQGEGQEETAKGNGQRRQGNQGYVVHCLSNVNIKPSLSTFCRFLIKDDGSLERRKSPIVYQVYYNGEKSRPLMSQCHPYSSTGAPARWSGGVNSQLIRGMG